MPSIHPLLYNLSILNYIQQQNPLILQMGNHQTSDSDSLTNELNSIYKQSRKDSNGTILINNQNMLTYLLKQFTFGSQMQYQKQLSRLTQESEAEPYENILSVCKVFSKEMNNFCSTSYKIYAIYEYPQVTLSEEILARQKEAKYFEEAELWSILQSCTSALIQLKPTISLEPTKIFIIPDGQLKVVHNDMIEDNYRMIASEDVYYAPEKLRNFNKIDNQCSLKKEAVFSMGMTLLQASQLDDVYSCYDYSENLFIEKSLEEMIEGITQKYSEDFIEILAHMLEPNPNRRASLMEIQNILNNYWNNEESRSEIQSQKQKYPDEIIEQQPQSKIPTQNEYPESHKKALKEFNQIPTIKSIEKQFIRTDETQRKSFLPVLQFQRQIEISPLPRYSLEPTLRKDKQNLYTDPKLLEMIRKDLEDINKLKQSKVIEATAKFPFLTQTQSLLSSVKQIDPLVKQIDPNQENQYRSTEPSSAKLSSCLQQVKPKNTFESINFQSESKKEGRMSVKNEISHNMNTNYQSLNDVKINMMKKPKENIVFTIETYEDGQRFEGMTINGVKNGLGKLIYQDGAYYEGEFKDNNMTGKGVLYYCAGKPAYDGMWVNGQFHGIGVLYNENPIALEDSFDFMNFNEVEDYWMKYEGEFEEDNKSGHGKLTLSNGETIEGLFSQDEINGDAIFTNVNGETIEGSWVHNEYVQNFDDQFD